LIIIILKSAEKAKEDIVRQIRALKKIQMKSTLQFRLQFKFDYDAKAKNPIEKSNAQIIAMLQDIVHQRFGFRNQDFQELLDRVFIIQACVATNRRLRQKRQCSR